ncbi:hypothetical protein ABZ092_19320 [Streptomyces bobili]|uniref:protein kinase domain-containing protein n=1 Tax=Streptomyces bobili TaxID=67280 RepID=UPI0033A509DE
MIGTAGYLAPEQAGAGESGAPGDVFSLAAVLVYASTGRGPFSRPNEEFWPAVQLYRIVHQEPNPDGVPTALIPFLRSCLAKDPGQRPAPGTVSVLLERLGGRCGTWPQLLPEALEEDLAVREEEAHALISTTVRSPSVPAVSREPEDGPAAADAGTAVLPPSDAVRRWVSSRTGRVVVGTTATALMATAGTFVVRRFSGDDAWGGTPSPSYAARSLPAAWAGAWVGTGPGNPTPDDDNQRRTNRFRATVQDARLSRSKPDRRLVTTGIEVIDQHGRTVLTMSAMNLFLRRQVIIGPG